MVDGELPQAVFHGGADGPRGEVAAHLGREEAALAVTAGQGASDDALAGAVALRRVDHGDAAVDGGAHGSDGHLFVDGTHGAAEGPGPEGDRGNLRAVSSQLSILPGVLSG